ncbi:MAG: tetratricopeptide repeat protein, partial [Gemmatimonadota bacterium]
MTGRVALLALWLGATGVLAQPGSPTGAYNLWAKERVRRLEERVNREPINPQVRVLLATAYYEDGQAFEAKQQLRRALELRPDCAEAHCNLAIILHAQSSLSEARQHYEAALAADSTLTEAMAGLGTLLCRTGQGRGIELLEEVLAREPGRRSARYNLAVAYHKAGDYPQAIAHLERLLAEDASYPEAGRAMAQACFGRGLALLSADQAAPALALFERALEFDRQVDDLYYAAGLAYLRLDDLPAAGAAFEAAVHLNPDHVPALHNLATVYERTGRPEEARSCYQRVQELTPHLGSIDAA